MNKFRAWHKELKKMYRVHSLCFSSEGAFSPYLAKEPPGTGLLPCSMQEMELMQSTGIKDSLGNEIFEGDILTHDYGGGVESFVVERNSDDNQLQTRYLYMAGYNTDYLSEAPLRGSIVVGDVWANPDLMVGDDE